MTAKQKQPWPFDQKDLTARAVLYALLLFLTSLPHPLP